MVKPGDNDEESSSPVFATAHAVERATNPTPAEADPVFISASAVENGAAPQQNPPQNGADKKEPPGNYMGHDEDGAVNSAVENGAAPQQNPPQKGADKGHDEDGAVNEDQREQAKKNCNCNCDCVVLSAICAVFALILGVSCWFSDSALVLALLVTFGVLSGLIACSCGARSYRAARHAEQNHNHRRKILALLGTLEGLIGILLCIGGSIYATANFEYSTYYGGGYGGW